MVFLKSRKDRILKISIILFQAVFLFQLFCNYNIIIVVNPFFKHVSEKYWTWFSCERSAVKNENLILAVSYIVKWLFSCVFLIEYMNILARPCKRDKIGVKKIVLFTGAAFVIYGISFVAFKYLAVHYRLFMTFVSTEILSLLLLALIFQIGEESE